MLPKPPDAIARSQGRKIEIKMPPTSTDTNTLTESP